MRKFVYFITTLALLLSFSCTALVNAEIYQTNILNLEPKKNTESCVPDLSDGEYMITKHADGSVTYKKMPSGKQNTQPTENNPDIAEPNITPNTFI